MKTPGEQLRDAFLQADGITDALSWDSVLQASRDRYEQVAALFLPESNITPPKTGCTVRMADETLYLPDGVDLLRSEPDRLTHILRADATPVLSIQSDKISYIHWHPKEEAQ